MKKIKLNEFVLSSSAQASVEEFRRRLKLARDLLNNIAEMKEEAFVKEDGSLLLRFYAFGRADAWVDFTVQKGDWGRKN